MVPQTRSDFVETLSVHQRVRFSSARAETCHWPKIASLAALTRQRKCVYLPHGYFASYYSGYGGPPRDVFRQRLRN